MPFPSPEDLPNPGIEPGSPALQADALSSEPPGKQETWVQSLNREDPLEKGMATQSSILAWRIPMGRGAWQATVHEVTKSQIGLSG